ncbi:thermonuclease family protein [Paracoccus sp. KR1-242]|uniref:thermonuclease family protein n=1 Tax=Paracoccus sp. KR1-242 TaxID=3410028 RepID=UPI003C10F6E0
MITLLAVTLVANIHVHDGDTIGRGKDRIRIWGIDAPELTEPGGPASRAHLRNLIAGQRLTCDLIDVDRYGRRVMRCVLPDGRDVACEMVAAGAAEDWPRYSGGRYRSCE